MFTLTDGRDYLYQWDINRSVRVSDPSVTEVHFCNRTGDCSLVTKVYANPTDSELYADIPNILLQSPFDIRVFAYCDCYTKVEETFKVKARTKPDDYVYTETEVITVQTIEKRMDELEESFNANIDATVSEYLNENPVQVDLTGYAKEEYVQSYVDTSIEDYNKTITEYIDTEIASIPEPDFTGYATEDYVDDAVSNIPGAYITLSTTGMSEKYAAATDVQIDFIESLLANPLQPIFVRHDSDSYPCLFNALGGNIWEITPCETASYLTANRGLYNTFVVAYKKTSDTWEVYCQKKKVLLATQSYVDTAIANIDIPSTEGLATTEYVDDAIANIEVSGGDVDLSNYYTKDETYSRTEVDNAIANAGGSGGGSGITDSFFLDFHNAKTSWTDADAEMIAFAEYYWNSNYSACAQIRDTHDELFYPSIIQAVDSTSYNFLKASINLNTVASNQPIEWDIIRLEKRSGVWKYCILAANSYVFGSADLTNYYTKAEVNSLFEGIAIAEERSY